MARARVAIINVTGYIGVDLARILLRHPDVDLACVTGRSAAGQQLADVFPHLADSNLTIEPELDCSVDLV
ncbi:MAG: N-acetyl-gamma-glutamyl-phosphate reductase, partial [Chloroflexota bacterium]